jgi:competence protein ComEC
MINWHESPFFRAVFALILGIISASFFLPPWYLLSAFSIVTTIIFLFSFNKKEYRWRWISGGASVVFFYTIGFFAVAFHDNSNDKNFIAQFLHEKQQANIVGIVSELPEAGKNTKITVDVFSINDTSTKARVLLYMKPTEYSKNVEYGDVISFTGYVNPIRISKNPETFDFQRYMKYHNIHHLCYVQEEDFHVLAQRRGNAILHFAYDSQAMFISILAQYLDTNDELSVASALIVGYRSQIPDEILQAYVNTGALHVLSVSGLHVGLVSVILNTIIRKIRGKSRFKFWKYLDPILQILFIWMFTFITGAAPCVLRAAVMFTFLILARSAARDSNVYNVLSASCFTLLCWNPYYLYDVGFQLSYMGLLGIVYFQPKIYAAGIDFINQKEWLYKIYHFRFADFKPKNKFVLSIIKFPVADYCWQMTSVSIAATVAVTPLSIFYFHQFPTYFWLSGLAVVPLAAWALYAGILLFIVHFISTTLAAWIGKILWVIIWLLNNSLFWIEKIPPGAIQHLWISGLATILLYFALLSLVAGINQRKVRWLTSGSLIFIFLASLKANYTTYQNFSKNEILIYNTGFYTLIDFFDGEKVFALGSKDIPERTINFAAYNYRLSRGISPDQVTFIGLQDTCEKSDFYYSNNFVFFKNKKFLILDKNPKDASEKIKTDYIFIRDNPEIDFDKIAQNIDYQMIIFDASNKKNKVLAWKKICDERKIPYHDIVESYLRIEIE